jgi:mannose-6-phosphate isomerase
MTTRHAGLARRVATAWGQNLPVTSGGYAESVHSNWTENPVIDRTIVTQARLAYTFSHGSRLRNKQFMKLADEKLARIAVEANRRMMNVFWKPELQGWIHAVDPEGKPTDTTIDTYDQSFAFLALAWDFLVRNNSESKDIARRALAALNQNASAPSGGYIERRSGGKAPPAAVYPGLRRQDPHMHLFEAFIAWHAVDAAGPWLERVAALLKLFREKFRQGENGAVASYFDEDLNPAPGEAGKICIPGDHYEWVWLLRQYEKLSGDSSVQKDAEALYGFAQNYGTDTDGLVFCSVDRDGNLLDGSKLFWMQTEKLKAQIAIYEWTGDAKVRDAAEKTIQTIQERYTHSGGDLFYNKLDKDGNPDTSPSLSRLLYHFFIATNEAERVLENP